MDKKTQDAQEIAKMPAPGSMPTRRPDESAAFSVEGHVKIFDPNTKEIYVEKRA